MKRIFCAGLLGLFAVSCSSFKVVVKEDAFKKTTIVTADMWHKVTEGYLDNMRAIYTKEIKNGIESEPELRLEFQCLIHAFTGCRGDKIDQEGYILVDEKSFKLNLTNLSANITTTVSGSGSTDASGKYSASATTHTWGHQYASLKIAPDIQKALLDANSYKIRVYNGKDATTLTATSSQLEAVKKFLQTKSADD